MGCWSSSLTGVSHIRRPKILLDTDKFVYHVSDGTSFSNNATVTLLVQNTNDAPVAHDDSYTIAQNTTLVVASKGVLKNDTDIDAVNPSLTAAIMAGPAHGTVVLSPSGGF